MILLPNTTLKISSLCLGTGNYGTSIDEITAFALLDNYVELGGNVLDTANVYGKWGAEKTNTSEQIIGKWLKANGNRSDIVLCTKGCHYDLETPHIPRLTPQALKEDLKESMDALGVDHIDLFYLHRDDPDTPVEVIVDMLHEQQQAGLIQHVGISNWSTERITSALAYAQNCVCNSFFAADQMMWSLAVPNKAEPAGPGTIAMDDVLFAFHQHTAMAVFSYSSQAKGFFTKVLRDGFDSNLVYDGLRDDYLNQETRNRVKLVRQIAEATGFDGTQIALAWLMNQPFTTIPIIGCRTVEQLESSFGALEGKLRETVSEKLKV